jgi:hypothetical protein
MNNKEAYFKKKRIAELKKELDRTDYIDNKLVRALVRYVALGDNTTIFELFNEYAEQIDQRQAWREEVDMLEKELENYKGV